MKFEIYKHAVKTTRKYPKDRALEYLPLGLVSEVGELCDLLKRRVRGDTDLDMGKVQSELGDIFWYLVNLCDELGVVPEAAFADNAAKLQYRLQHNMVANKSLRDQQEQLDFEYLEAKREAIEKGVEEMHKAGWYTNDD